MNNLSAISWQEQVTFLWVSEWLLFNAKWTISQLYHDKNKLHFFEWVSDCCLMPSEQSLSCIMTRTSYISLSEWLLFNAKWTISQLYHDKNKLHFFEWVWLLFNAKWTISQLYHDKNKLHFFEWVSDCCLMPSEQSLSYIMTRTSYISLSEWLLFNAKWTISQLYHDKNKLHFFEWVSDCCLMPSEQSLSCIMTRTSYISFEWVSDCCLMPSEQSLSYIMTRTSYISLSEWLLFNAKWTISQLYHDKNKLHFFEWVIVV